MTGCEPFGKCRAQSRGNLSKQLKCPVDFSAADRSQAVLAPSSGAKGKARHGLAP
jgi:hypothetical protein